VGVAELEALSAAQADAVLKLRDAVALASGTSPLSDPVVGALRTHLIGRHFLQTDRDEAVGYANIVGSDRPVAELLIGPDGDLVDLVEAVSAAAGPALRIWTRGDAAPLNDVLPTLGFHPVRTLLQLRRPLGSPPLAEPVWADGVTVRTFRVGEDETAWLAVNNAAFITHPEQGEWVLADIRGRENEPWFDPAGFFLAESDGQVVGFHWTKVHEAHRDGDRVGEVYVIGVDPSMQGKRLGEALLLHGLRHLRDAGLATVLLYVESDNLGALALYERHGFTRWDADRSFAKAE
jgi:mycothiol synthase